MSTASQLQPVPTRPRTLAQKDRVGIGHALVDNCSFDEAVTAILDHATADGPPAYVITPNAQHVVLLENDLRLQKIYRRADLVVADGVSILLAARIFGRAMPERVTGVDLFQAVCIGAARRGLKVFLLGGRPGSADLAASKLLEQAPELQVDTYCPPLGFEHDAHELSLVAGAIRASQPHLLFVAFGAPKQEYWVYDHGRKLGVNVCIGIGGSFEMVGGIVTRAPGWVQRFGCEWLYRLCKEPRRMWRRYLVGNAQFLTIVLNQRVRRAVLAWFVNTLKQPSFEPEFQDAGFRAEAVHILTRITANHPEGE